MTDRDIQDALLAVLQGMANFDDTDLACIARASTYESSGILTNDAGLVIQMEDGSEFQLTIILSR